MDENDVKGKIVDFLKYAKKNKKNNPEPGRIQSLSGNAKANINMAITGNNNTQIAGEGFVLVNYNTSKPNIKILPPHNSIGNDSLLKNRIQTLFNKIGDERKKRFGQSAFPVMYKKFKTDFKIKNNKWTVVWEWPKECADQVISYLQDKYNNTIRGRIENAASKKNYMHTRPHLYKQEKEFLSHLGLKLDSEEVKTYLKTYFGVTSHTKLTHLEHWQFVCYIEGLVDELEKSD